MPRDYAATRAQLDAMRAALAAVVRERAEVWRQMVDEAERRAAARYPEWRRPNRCSTRWLEKDRRLMDQHLVALHFERGRELTALDRKAARKRAAIEAFRLKHGCNEPEARAA